MHIIYGNMNSSVMLLILIEILGLSKNFVFFFLIQFYVPFKIISAHMRRVNQ